MLSVFDFHYTRFAQTYFSVCTRSSQTQELHDWTAFVAVDEEDCDREVVEVLHEVFLQEISFVSQPMLSQLWAPTPRRRYSLIIHTLIFHGLAIWQPKLTSKSLPYFLQHGRLVSSLQKSKPTCNTIVPAPLGIEPNTSNITKPNHHSPCSSDVCLLL